MSVRLMSVHLTYGLPTMTFQLMLVFPPPLHTRLGWGKHGKHTRRLRGGETCSAGLERGKHALQGRGGGKS